MSQRREHQSRDHSIWKRTMNPSVSLPQPKQSGRDHPSGSPTQPYQYVTYDVLENDWAGDPQLLMNFINATKNVRINNESNGGLPESHPSNIRYKEGALVWVLLSKGKSKSRSKKSKDSIANSNNISLEALQKKVRDKKHTQSIARTRDRKLEAVVRYDDPCSKGDERTCKPIHDCDLKTGVNVNKYFYVTEKNGQDENPNMDTSDNTLGQYNRSELFLRARVVSDNIEGKDEYKDKIEFRKDERRVLVRYSKGSTYHVRASNLIPVIEPSFHKHTNHGKTNLPPMVIITPETNIYRRMAVIHTTPEDSFVEIGCDYGITVDRIRRSLEEGGTLPKEWDGEAASISNGEKLGGNNIVSCLGIDKSAESIGIATGRYPKCKFTPCDVLIPEEMASIRALCEQSLVGEAPSVVAIDVNGNREIDGVLQCLQSVINQDWKQHPRLIIVKSRYLYWQLKKSHENFKEK